MLLQETNRLSEAEPLMKRALEIFLLFTRPRVMSIRIYAPLW